MLSLYYSKNWTMKESGGRSRSLNLPGVPDPLKAILHLKARLEPVDGRDISRSCLPLLSVLADFVRLPSTLCPTVSQ